MLTHFFQLPSVTQCKLGKRGQSENREDREPLIWSPFATCAALQNTAVPLMLEEAAFCPPCLWHSVPSRHSCGHTMSKPQRISKQISLTLQIESKAILHMKFLKNTPYIFLIDCSCHLQCL